MEERNPWPEKGIAEGAFHEEEDEALRYHGVVRSAPLVALRL